MNAVRLGPELQQQRNYQPAASFSHRVLTVSLEAPPGTSGGGDRRRAQAGEVASSHHREEEGPCEEPSSSAAPTSSSSAQPHHPHPHVQQQAAVAAAAAASAAAFAAPVPSTSSAPSPPPGGPVSGGVVAVRSEEDQRIIDSLQSRLHETNSQLVTLMKDLREAVECPVCFNIPRSPPVPCCRNGHVICARCKTKCDACPKCRSSKIDCVSQVRYLLN